ncbi:MAG: hypothetical protein VCC36_00700 [Gammaproteobacteria bacterium]
MTEATSSRESIVVRFAGDSGDGMQLMGTQFVTSTALAGNDFATFPDYPAEIRAIDTDKSGLGGVLEAAHGHDGATFVEIFQNCIVYNDKVFGSFTDKDNAADAQIRVEHGQPLTFGENNSKGLRLDMESLTLEVVDGQHSDVLVHDETNATMAQLLLAMEPPTLPMALEVIRRRPGQSFETSFYAAHPTGMARTARVADVLRQTNTWTVD